MRRNKKRWLRLGLTTAVAATGCGGPEPAPAVVRPVRAMRVADIGELAGRSFPGRAQATRVVNHSFRVSGPLVARPIDVGDVVVEGQILARIDPRDFEVNLRNVRAQLQEAKATRALAVEEYDRAKQAYDRGGVSDIELARQLAARERAKAQVDALEASVESVQDALDYTNLKAPFEGTVVAIFVENFETVQAKQMIVRLVDDSRIEMLIEIPENLIALAQYVTDITCTFDAFPGVPIPATIKEIGTEASETTRTYPVTLIMDQPQGFKILPGMSGVATGREVRPGKSGDELHIEVPLSAVASPDGSESYVWVIDESTGTVHRRTVTLGGMTTRGLLVGGLEADLWIATAGVHYLQEGQRVRILAAARESPR